MAITPHIKYGLFFTELVQQTLAEQAKSGHVFYFERTQRLSGWDREKVDFIIHECLNSSPLYLQVKGGARSKNTNSRTRRGLKSRGISPHTRLEELEECISRGVKVITLNRDSTTFETWARLWYLLRTDEMRSPSVENKLWEMTLVVLGHLLRDGVIDAYEPKSLDTWIIQRVETKIEFSLPPEKPSTTLYEQVKKILVQSFAIAE